MRYVSVCSGVEAASLAWEFLEWKPVWFSEVDKFPSAVLAHRFPHIPNLGDMTKIKCLDCEKGLFEYEIEGALHRREFGKVDLLVGGTPCQSFSVAGNQEGLGGVSGLALAYVELLKSLRPKWFVWENVPGVFSTNGGADFTRLVRAFDALGYSFAWRVLDVQFCRVDGFPYAIAQRRRRVFVVGHSSGDWRYPAEALFEPRCLPRSLAPRRIKGKDARLGGFEKASEGERRIFCNEVVGTLCAGDSKMPNQQMVGDGKLIIHCAKGVDAYNMNVTGDVGSCIRAEGNRNESQPVVMTYEHHPQDKRVKSTEVSGTLGTYGNALQGKDTLVQECARAVRRITPIEAERLMGFPDNWTRIPWRGKGVEECPDGLRYKCCGNSMGVNVMRWLGLRIERVERIANGL